MAFFDDLGKHLSSAAKTVGQKANDVSEIRKLNTKKQAIRRQMEAAYTQIGKAYFATVSAATHGEADRLCDQIEAMLSEIAELDAKIDKVKKQRRCPNCNAIQPSGSKFCSGCGAKLPEPAPEPEPEPEPEPAPEPEKDKPEAEDEADVQIDWPMPGAADAEDEHPEE